MNDSRTVDPDRTRATTEMARSIPFLVRCGFELERCVPGEAEGKLLVTKELAGATGHLNGTELYGLLDCTAWFSVAQTLAEGEAAVTHDAHFSILSTAPTGSEVRLRAHVDKRGRTVAFVGVEASVEGRLFARATITKSIISLTVRMRHAGTPDRPA